MLLARLLVDHSDNSGFRGCTVGKAGDLGNLAALAGFGMGSLGTLNPET